MAYKTETDLRWEQIQITLFQAYKASVDNNVSVTKAKLKEVELMLNGIPNTIELND